MAARVPEARFGLAYAIKQSAIPLSILIGGLAVPTVALTLHWRAAYGLAVLDRGDGGALVPPRVMPVAGRAERPVPDRERAATWLLSGGLVAAVVGHPGSEHTLLLRRGHRFLRSHGRSSGGRRWPGGLAVRIAAGIRADRVQGGRWWQPPSCV